MISLIKDNLLELEADKKSAVISFKNKVDNSEGTIIILSGNINETRVSSPIDKLGDILVFLGVLSKIENIKLISEFEKTKNESLRYGQFLLSKNSVQEADLKATLSLQHFCRSAHFISWDISNLNIKSKPFIPHPLAEFLSPKLMVKNLLSLLSEEYYEEKTPFRENSNNYSLSVQVSILLILKKLRFFKFSGTLEVVQDEIIKKISFLVGIPTKIESNSPKDLFGNILVKYGFASIEEIEDGLTIQKNNKKKLGEILIENNILSEDEIENILAIQFQEKLLNLNTFVNYKLKFSVEGENEKSVKSEPSLQKMEKSAENTRPKQQKNIQPGKNKVDRINANLKDRTENTSTKLNQGRNKIKELVSIVKKNFVLGFTLLIVIGAISFLLFFSTEEKKIDYSNQNVKYYNSQVANIITLGKGQVKLELRSGKSALISRENLGECEENLRKKILIMIQ